MGLIGGNIGGCRGTLASSRRQQEARNSKTDSELCQIASWDCFGEAIASSLADIKLGRKLG